MDDDQIRKGENSLKIVIFSMHQSDKAVSASNLNEYPQTLFLS